MDWIKEAFGAFVAWMFDGWIMWAIVGAILGTFVLLIFIGIRMTISDKMYASGLRAAGYRDLDEVKLIPKPTNPTDADERPTETVPVIRGTVKSFVFYPSGSGEGVDITEHVSGVTLGVGVDTEEDLPPIEETDDGTASDGPEHEGDQNRITSHGGSWFETFEEYPPRSGNGFTYPGEPESGCESGWSDLVHTDHGHVASNGSDSVRVGYGPWVQYIEPGEYPFGE